MSVERSALIVERSSSAGRAVFLGYASQDAEAAKRIADAFRAAGVEGIDPMSGEIAVKPYFTFGDTKR